MYLPYIKRTVINITSNEWSSIKDAIIINICGPVYFVKVKSNNCMSYINPVYILIILNISMRSWTLDVCVCHSDNDSVSPVTYFQHIPCCVTAFSQTPSDKIQYGDRDSFNIDRNQIIIRVHCFKTGLSMAGCLHYRLIPVSRRCHRAPDYPRRSFPLSPIGTNRVNF